MPLIAGTTKTSARIVAVHFTAFAVVFLFGCGKSRTTTFQESDLVIVNAPASGTVSKVLVPEGSKVESGTPLVEITLPTAAGVQPSPGPQSRPAATNYRDAQADIQAAQKEVERTGLEVQRVGALVSGGSAPQSQLDAARAQFQAAEKRLQLAQAQGQSAAIQLATAKATPAGATTAPVPQTAVLRAPQGGILKVVNARVGQEVRNGQPLVTMTAEK